MHWQEKMLWLHLKMQEYDCIMKNTEQFYREQVEIGILVSPLEI